MILKKLVSLDGYPRTIDQVMLLIKSPCNLSIQLDAVINIEVNPDSLLQNVWSGRIIHRETGKPHKVFSTHQWITKKKITINEDDKPKETVKTSFDVNIAVNNQLLITVLCSRLFHYRHRRLRQPFRYRKVVCHEIKQVPLAHLDKVVIQ